MTPRLHLHVPTYEELSYRKSILSQPETMDYNRGYDFEYVRSVATKAHMSAGFTKYKEENGILELIITKDQYNFIKTL